MEVGGRFRFVTASEWSEMTVDEIVMSLEILENTLRHRELSREQALSIFDEALNLLKIARKWIAK